MIAAAQGRTLREVRLLCTGEQRESAAAVRDECTLTLTVDREDVWLFEATRALLDALGTRGADEQIEALLAEAQDTLLAALPQGVLELEEIEGVDEAQRRWLDQLRGWREEAERLCEPRIRGALGGVGLASEAQLGCASFEGKSAEELDASVRALSAALAGHELALARHLLTLHRLNGWRRLGYATEGQYARERLGMSRSALLAKRALAVRLEQLPHIAEALSAGRIGVEAALQVVRIATPRTEVEWLERARQRTVKHLREEVVAALTAVRLSGEADCPPPIDAELGAVQELERAVVSGRVCEAGAQPKVQDVPKPAADRRAWPEALRSLERWLEQGVQFSAGSAAPSSAGRVTLRLRVARSTQLWWRALEAQASRWLPRGMSWLKFSCLCLWGSWRHLLGEDVAYGRIYIRDRHRCSSPVCSRRDVTPHHLTFRSAGGGEEDENLASLCTWCHLFGVHGGRIRTRGRASDLQWELGSREQPCLRVHGRERL